MGIFNKVRRRAGIACLAAAEVPVAAAFAEKVAGDEHAKLLPGSGLRDGGHIDANFET